MKYRRTSRFLSIVLLVAMVLTLMPTAAFAEDSAVTESWELIGGAEAIEAAAAENTVTVTMTTEDGTTYVLYNGNGTSSAPTGVIAEISDGKLSLGDVPSDRVSWNIEAEDGGYTIYSAADSSTWLYSTNANNGVRVGTNTAKKWVVDSNYLKHDGTGRFLGVYTSNPDWRAYTSINTNITGQTLQFWKLVTEEGGGTIDPPEPTEPPEEPVEETAPFVKLDAAPADGDKVLIFNPGSAVVMGLEDYFYNNTKHELAPVAAALDEDGKLTPAEGYALLTVKLTEDGKYSFVNQDGKFLEVDGTHTQFVETESANTLFQLEEAEGGYYVKCDTAAYNGRAQYLQYYYNYFTVYSLNTNYPERYVFAFYKEAEEEEPAAEYSTIAEALAASEGEFTVKGVVTLLDNRNVYIQDATGGICLYLSAAPTDLALGDTVIGTGSRTVYRGLPELGSATYEKSSGLTLTAKETSIGALSTADVCTYVKLTGLTVTEVYDNNGAYSAPNITLKDENGGTIQIYKAVVGKTDGVWDLAVDDVIDFTGAVGINNSTLQLRNTLATEITKAETPVEPAYSTIAEALAATEGEFTVKGVVTLLDNRNVYIQDATGGICLYLSAAPTDLALGDTVIGTGTRTVYRGLPELGSATYEKSSGLTLTAKETSIGALTTADVCSYVKLTGLTVTEVYDNNGAYSAPNITVKDETGATIQIYKAVVGKTDGVWDLAVDDVIDFTGAVGINNSTLQLRNTLAEEISRKTETKTGLVTDLADLTDGSYVVIYNPGHSLAISSETYQDWYLLGAAATIEDGQTIEPAANLVWKVSVNADGSYTFTQDNYTVAAWLSGTYVELTNNASYNTETASGWNLETCNAENGTFYVSSSSLSTSYGKAYIEAYYKKQVSGDTFCGYSTGVEKLTEKDYGLQFYLVAAPEGGDTPVEPSGSTYGLASTLNDGDTVILYNAANKVALGNTVASHKITGVSLTPENGVITTDEEAVAWTVTVNADGTYTFKQGEKTLGGVVSGTYNNLVPTDASFVNWTLTGPDAEDFNYYLYLDEMESSYGKVYLEYYNGFTLYGSSSPDKTAYGITFYKQGAEAETPSGGEEPAEGDIAVGTLVTSLDQLTDGATVLIYSPTHKTAASSVPNGDWYIKAEGPITDSFTAPLVWTVTKNADGSFRFANGENILSAWPSGNYVELTVNAAYNSETVSDWSIAQCNAATHTWYISSTTLKVNDRTAYVEAYLRNGTEVFSGYATNSPSEDNYGLQFYLVDPADASSETDDGTWDGVLTKGAQYVVYNASAEGVLGIPNDMGNALTLVAASIEGGKAKVANGAMVFTVADNPGRYYVFEAGGKYLATNNAEELFFKDEIDEYTKWYLTKNGSGYLLYNKTANYNGTPVCIEFFSGFFSGWTFKSTDADIFRFNFYPLADDTAVVDGVAQVPTVNFACEDSRYIEQDYEVKFSLDDLAPEITDIAVTYTIGDKTEKVQEMSFANKTGSFILPASVLDASGVIASFTITVSVTNSYGLSYTGEKTVTVVDEPFIGKLTPAANAQTLEDKRPVISAEIGNVGENAVFTMTVNDEPVEAVFADGILRYQAAEDMADGRYTVIVTVERADGKAAEKMWSFYVGKAQFQLFFGQLHSHTTYSDGSGSLEAALDYISAIPKSANVQFVAFTDHSNYFDSTSAANPEEALYDVSQMTAASKATWDSYKQTVADFNANSSDLIAIAGFEMTWSGGPGHINTFNSPGIVSRNNATLNNKTNDAGMKAYYALLDNEALSDALSQFNHPGKTFGNFTDFSYWDAVTDSRIFLVEVGNGEGQIGAGGYYPSYEQYIMALDKGWHVGPTNNQDNHKGRWGNANDARDVIYTDDFSEQGLYDAIRQYRIYATEDKNLEIQYSVNGEPLGTIFSEIPEELAFSVSLYDPDSSDSITKVELVANSGAVAYTWDDVNEIKTGLLETTLAPTYSYYFVRVTQADGDLAVTAPVWVGESLKLGISAVECGTSTPVTGEEFTLSTTFFNSEASAATVKSIVYTVNGSEVIGTDTEAHSIPASSTATVEFKYIPTKAKIMTITVTAVVELDGVEYTFSKDIELQVKDSDALVYIGIDASHYNEYVAGNYKDSMGNFGALAGGYGVRTVELKTSEELIAACSNEKFVAIIFTAPSRRLAAAQADPKTYSAEELAAITAFNQAGGQVIVCGWGDNYENYEAVKTAKQMAETQNELLAALGSSIRLGDDEIMDDELNGGQSQRVYFDAFNFDSYLMQGVIVDPENPNDRKYSEVYSNYGGCSVYFEGDGVPATVTPIVYGHASTYTKDCDGDGKNDLAYPYGDGNRFVVMASEQLADKGLIIVAGAAFMSNFEVQAAASSGSSDADQQMNYANYKICENLVKGFNEITVTPIAEVQKQTEIGLVYTIEGTVTSNASGYDKDTAFFDCIYVQDETAGICCFPVSGNFKIGDVVRITGYTDFYQAEMELQVMSIEKIGDTDPVQPIEVTAAQINDLSVLGSLVTLKGTVESFEYENGLIQTIMVKDAAGDIARVFIDGYITTAEDVKDLTVGCRIEATGLSSYDDTWKDTAYFPRIRVRDRADIVCSAAADAAVVYGRSLLLQSQIGVRFYLDLPESVLEDSAAYVSIDGVKFPVSSAATRVISGKTCYSFTIYVKLTELSKQHVLRVFSGEDEVITLLDREGADYTETGYSYVAQQYIEAARKTADEKLIKMVNALSDLGSLAQQYFKVDVENRAEVLADLSTVTLESVSQYAAKVDVKDGTGLNYIGSSLLLREDITIRHYFKVTGDISQYTFKVDGKKVTPVQKGDYYYVQIDKVYSTDLDKSFHVEVSTSASGVIAEIDYCALSYAYKQLKKGEESELTDLIRALVLYSQEAETYFGA